MGFLKTTGYGFTIASMAAAAELGYCEGAGQPVGLAHGARHGLEYIASGGIVLGGMAVRGFAYPFRHAGQTVKHAFHDAEIGMMAGAAVGGASDLWHERKHLDIGHVVQHAGHTGVKGAEIGGAVGLAGAIARGAGQGAVRYGLPTALAYGVGYLIGSASR